MEIIIKKTDLPEKKIIEVSKSPKILVYFDGEKKVQPLKNYMMKLITISTR